MVYQRRSRRPVNEHVDNRPQPICARCGKPKNHHGAISQQCPAGRNSQGYVAGGALFFTPKGDEPQMTPDQKTLARALARVTFPPGINTKRFALDMAINADQPYAAPLTYAQSEYLRTAVIRYRNQLGADLVALAESMNPFPIQKGSAA